MTWLFCLMTLINIWHFYDRVRSWKAQSICCITHNVKYVHVKKSASQVHKMQICTMCSFHTEQNLWFSDNFLWNFYIRRGLRKISKFHIFERFGIVFRKRVINIAFLELRPLSNERSDNFTFYRGIHEFLNSFIFEK